MRNRLVFAAGSKSYTLYPQNAEVESFAMAFGASSAVLKLSIDESTAVYAAIASLRSAGALTCSVEYAVGGSYSEARNGRLRLLHSETDSKGKVCITFVGEDSSTATVYPNWLSSGFSLASSQLYEGPRAESQQDPRTVLASIAGATVAWGSRPEGTYTPPISIPLTASLAEYLSAIEEQGYLTHWWEGEDLHVGPRVGSSQLAFPAKSTGMLAIKSCRTLVDPPVSKVTAIGEWTSSIVHKTYTVNAETGVTKKIVTPTLVDSETKADDFIADLTADGAFASGHAVELTFSVEESALKPFEHLIPGKQYSLLGESRLYTLDSVSMAVSGGALSCLAVLVSEP